MGLSTGTRLPQDADSAPIQALSPVEGSVAVHTLSGVSSAVALPSGAELVEVSCTGNMLFAFGNSGVSATTSSRVLPTGCYVYKVPYSSGNTLCTHFAAITVDGSSGRVSVARLV